MRDPRPSPRPGPSRSRRALGLGLVVAVAAALAVVTAAPAAADPTTPSTGARPATSGTPAATGGGSVYYVDAINGDDGANGLSPATAWRTQTRVTAATPAPGSVIAYRRGQTFSGAATIAENGTSSNPIRIAAYDAGAPPVLTNPRAWNMLRLEGDHIHVSQLKFSGGVVFDNSDGQGISGPKYRLSGAIAITTGADSVRVVDNEFTDVGVGVKTYGLNTVIDHNHFHDLVIAYRGVDAGSETSYGALGVSINNSGAEVSWNDFINCRSTNSPYGADGGAIEIEGFDHVKNDITIHHNHSRGSQGFLEVTETTSSHVTLRYNLSDDYQQFVAWDTTTEPHAYLAEHNTVIRTRGDGSRAFDVYYYREPGPAPTSAWLTFRNNIFHMTGATVLSGFDYPHDHNLFAGRADPLGFPLGEGDLLADPRFVDLGGADYHLSATSPAIDNGTSAGGSTDLDAAAVGVGIARDMGAYEYRSSSTGGSNLVADPGFETQTAITSGSSPWSSQGSLSFGVDQGAGKARSGWDNGWVSSGGSTAWGAVRQTVSVAPNTNYRLTVWVRNSGTFDAGYLGVKTTGGTVINEVRHGRMAAAYNRVVVTFRSGSNTGVVLHAGFFGPGGSGGWEQIDDVSLQAV